MDLLDYPIILTMEDERCELALKLSGFDSVFHGVYKSAGELLCIFLNRRYVPDLITMEQLRRMGFKSQLPPESFGWHYWLDYWEHEKVEKLIRDIYCSESKAVNNLKPRQRFRIYLAFNHDLYSSCFVEQPFSDATPILDHCRESGVSFSAAVERVHKKRKGKPEQARYEAACQLANDYDIYLPKQEMYGFASPGELIFWLLRYVMERNKYILTCDFCGRYYAPARNTKKYCSEACAGKQRALDGFCGEKEIYTLYNRIVSNLSDKSERLHKLQLPYVSAQDPGTWIKPGEVLKEFYAENYDYHEALRKAFMEVQKDKPTDAEKEQWENAKAMYLTWLQARYEYALSLRLDYRAGE